MFSSKHKNTAFFSPLNQFSDVCQMALKAIPGLNKAFRNFLTNTLLMFALLPRKVNFTQLEIYGNYCEKTYRSGFSKHFDWAGFNLELSNRLWGAGGRKAIAIDPSYISKSGKHILSPPTRTCPLKMLWSSTELASRSSFATVTASSSLASATARPATSPSWISLSTPR